MTGNVKWLKDKQDNIIIPNTLTTSVYNSDGKNIEELLDEEYQKQKVAIGENLGEWELVTTGLSIATTEIVYGNDVYVAIYNYGIYYSNDNATWTLANYPSVRGDNYGLTFGNGMFIVVGGYGKTMYSYDGINWSAGVAVNSYASLTRVQYCKDRFIVTGYGGVDTVPSLYYSEDGINWIAANITTGLNYAKATYGNNMFVTIKSNGGAYYSEDGITWITATVPRYTMSSIAFGNGKFVVIHSDGYISYSEDGINWTMIDKLTTSTIYRMDIAFANGIFVAMTDKYVFRSKDGIEWYRTEYLNQTTDSYLTRINYTNNEFIICYSVGNNYVAKFLDNAILIEDALNELYLLQEDKVDKVSGKGLSTNDFTDADKEKLDSILGNFASEYDNTATYNVNDYCLYGGLLYKCTTAITVGEEFDSNKWVKTDCGSEISDLKNNISENSTDIATLLDRLTWKTLTNAEAKCTTIGDGSFIELMPINNILVNANEVLITIDTYRVGQFHLMRNNNPLTFVTNTYVTNTNPKYSISVTVGINWQNGSMSIQCSDNTWGLDAIPVTVPANSIIYR